MVCACCVLDRAARTNKPFPNNRSGRRLKEALAFIEQLMAGFVEMANNMDESDTEGDVELCAVMQTTLRAVAGRVAIKFGWLKSAPAYFVRADTPNGARECIRLLGECPKEQHEPVGQWWQAEMLEDLLQVEQGGVVTEKLKDAISFLNDATLDESAGESFHRGTHYTMHRAASTTRWMMLADQRYKQNIERVRRWLRVAKNVVDEYDGLTCKRLVGSRVGGATRIPRCI